ncbi:MAG TPA: SRPBCC family protein [Polyangia bacterium]|nr:SRPBCC family protein [Polyangia bacterium]
MSGREPVQKRYLLARATPAEVYGVVTDFAAYPNLFPEIKGTRVVTSSAPGPHGKTVTRVEFRGQVVLPVRYVLDLVCDPTALTVEWTFVEGEIVTNSVGGWRFRSEGEATDMEYRVSLDVKAPVPGFVLRKVTDGLVSASIPSMFSAIEREVRKRQSAQPRQT